MTVSIRFDLPPERALEFFQKKGLATSFAWQDLLHQEHEAAFTVAKMMDMDLLSDVRDAVERAITDGISFEDFRAELEPTLADRGWWGRKEMTDPQTGQVREVQLGSPRRLRTIYQTNLRTAYAAGHWDRIVDTAEEAPFLLYDAVLDERTRPEHAEWDGTLLRYDDPWWEDHYPPNGWNCRCSVVQLDADQAQAILGKSAPDTPPSDPAREWVNPRTGEVQQVPRGIDPGWNYHPGRARTAKLRQDFTDKVRGAGTIGASAAAALERALDNLNLQ
ncbi:MAG: phage minor head protein [Gammaproteobacteria bacterium]